MNYHKAFNNIRYDVKKMSTTKTPRSQRKIGQRSEDGRKKRKLARESFGSPSSDYSKSFIEVRKDGE
jgi:hypothetical protein